MQQFVCACFCSIEYDNFYFC